MDRIRFSVVALAMLISTASASAQAPDVSGHWVGEIDTPGAGLGIDVDFSTEGGTLRGDISIPVQGVQDMELIGVSQDGTSVRFAMPDIPGDPTFAGTVSEDGDRITGTFTQGGASLDFGLTRGDQPAVKARASLDGFGDFVARAIEEWNVPGSAIAVVAGGEVVFAEGFGLRDVERQLPMTPDTLFAIGSTTKAFTATLLGTLVDEGLLAWDAPLTTFLPEFRLSDPTATQLMTPRDLVTHRSGLPRHDLLWYNNNESTRAELVARLAHLELSEQPRAKFQYNNLMFMTAGYLAGRLTGSTWEEAMRARLLDPLGMTRTNFSVSDSQQDDDFSQPYREHDDTHEIELIPFRPIDLIGPAGSLNSSVNEMAKWLLFNLNRGKVGDRQLIDPGILADVHSPHMTTGETPERPEISQGSYGLGWGIDTYRGHRRIAHGGGIDGFITSVMLFPDDGVGIVAFVNRGSGLPGVLAQHAADLVLDLESIDWYGEGLEERKAALEAQEKAEEKMEETRVPDTSPAHPLVDYAGEYWNPGYGTLEISLDGDRLSALFNNIETPLDHWHYDVWNGARNDDDPTFEDTRFQFRSNVEGDIASVESSFEARLDPIVFDKRPDSRLYDAEYLERYVGRYELSGQVVTVGLSGSTLTVSIPGQPMYTLEPEVGGRFTLVEVPIIKVGFVEDEEGTVSAATFFQPNGVFEAERVE